MKRSHHAVFRGLSVAFLFLSLLVVGASEAGATPFTPLALQNGWTNAPFATRNAGVSFVSGIVHFAGAIAGGTSPVAFTLPIGFQPATNVFIPVDLCNAAKGRLIIQPSGVVSVEAEGNAFTNAQCFTSLEGASFAPSASGFTALVPQNGWTNAPFSTSDAAVENLGGIVHFKGAIASGANSVVFTLPNGFQPTTNVYIPVDLCKATKGRLIIQSSGVVSVEAEGNFSNAQCFTSLDGASFAQNTSAFTPLILQNGWTNAPSGTGTAAVEDIGGILHFKGAIATSGTNPVPFALPSGFRPDSNVYVPVDLCNATKGRLVIDPSGVVTVQAEGNFSNAQCVTSLDGASFAITSFVFTPIDYYAVGCQPPCRPLELFIPDNDPEGVRSVINVTPAGLAIQHITVDVDITHTFRGDLVIQVISPSGQVATLSNRAGGSADNFVANGLDLSSTFTSGSIASGQWQLFVRDLAAQDVGKINSFVLHIMSTR